MHYKTFSSWKTIFEGHFDHLYSLHGHENTRHPTGQQKSINLFFSIIKKALLVLEILTFENFARFFCNTYIDAGVPVKA
jgi:hypothetical protein